MTLIHASAKDFLLYRPIRQDVGKESAELLLEFRLGIKVVVKQIQEQLYFSIAEEGRSSVPRYILLLKQMGQKTWRGSSEAFHESYQLHLLCEAHFDDGSSHEVVGQEGITLTLSKERLLKVPSSAVDKAAIELLEDDAENQGQDERGERRIASHAINVKQKLKVQEVAMDLIRELGYAEFAKKIGLRKVLLREAAQPRACSSTQAEPWVLWICCDCYKKYGDRATVISHGR